MPKTWTQLTDRERADLTAWLNREPDASDKRRLAKLIERGQFGAWDCPRCSERCHHGEPDDWGHFQGARQVDHTSYPAASEAAKAWCDHCRCYHQSGPGGPANVTGTLPWFIEDAEARAA